MADLVPIINIRPETGKPRDVPYVSRVVVFADQDEYTSIYISSYRTWAAELETHSGARDRFKTVEVGNATHFWRGQASERLQHVLLEWLQ